MQVHSSTTLLLVLQLMKIGKHIKLMYYQTSIKKSYFLSNMTTLSASFSKKKSHHQIKKGSENYDP